MIEAGVLIEVSAFLKHLGGPGAGDQVGLDACWESVCFLPSTLQMRTSGAQSKVIRQDSVSRDSVLTNPTRNPINEGAGNVLPCDSWLNCACWGWGLGMRRMQSREGEDTVVPGRGHRCKTRDWCNSVRHSDVEITCLCGWWWECAPVW